MRNLVAVVVALPWVVWALVRTLGFELPYPFVAMLAFTPYAALSSPLPVVAGLLLRRWVVAGVAAVAMVAFAVALLPRAVGGPAPDAQGPRLVVMTSNLLRGQADIRAALEIARGHDVDVWSVQELAPNLMPRLNSASARGQFPSRVLDPLPNAAGTGLLTRRPLRLVDNAVDVTGHEEPEIEVDVPGAPPVRVKAVHPAPPVHAAAAPVWRRSLAALPGSDGRGDVQILAGDFNATLDHAELRGVLDHGYIDAADAAGEGWTWTWPALPRRALPLTIDHVLVDKRVKVEKVTVVRIPGSDHRAVIAVLRLPRE